MAITLAVGTRLPAYATSMGRVLLAALPPAELDERLARTEIRPLTRKTVADETRLRAGLEQARDQGWAMVDQELEEGVRSAAAPIRDASGTVVAALNVSAHASRTSLQALRRDILPLLLETAAAIEAELHTVAGPASRALRR
jgi:IclR family pca regulon transcriptional regulator